MRKYTLHILDNAEEAARAAAAEFVRIGSQFIAEKNRFCVALAGGKTPKRMYELLARPPLRHEIDWSRVEFFWSDERTAPPASAESNFHLAAHALLEPLHVATNQIHRMHGEAADLVAAAEDYQAEIARTLGTSAMGEPPSFDLVLLGLGEDGHTASIFPATAALLESSRWVLANQVLKLNSQRLTLTPMLINRAAHVLFLVTGANKAAALAEVLEGKIDTQRLPAQIIRPAQGRVHWFVDKDAAAQLSSESES